MKQAIIAFHYLLCGALAGSLRSETAKLDQTNVLEKDAPYYLELLKVNI